MTFEDKVNSSIKELAKCQADNKSQSEFMSMVIHQLRAPLAGIKWTFEMLLDGDLGSFTDDQKKIIRMGFDKNKEMVKLLEEVTLANQNNSWDFQYNFESLDLESL